MASQNLFMHTYNVRTFNNFKNLCEKLITTYKVFAHLTINQFQVDSYEQKCFCFKSVS